MVIIMSSEEKKKRFCAHCGKELRDDEHNMAESDLQEVCDDCFNEDEELEEMFFL
jgi:NMD protein affecting ribosome stability and mRNA decay